MLSEVIAGGSSLARARAAMSFLTICDGWSSSSCVALPLPLVFGVAFLRGVAATLGLVVVSEGAEVGIGFGAGVLRIDLGWGCC